MQEKYDILIKYNSIERSDEMEKEEKSGENEESIKIILDIVKGNYSQYYQRMQSIDNKSGFFIAFHGAVLLLLVNPDNINNMLKIEYQNIGQILKYGAVVLLGIGILILAIISICLFICSLKSRSIKYIPNNICEEKYFKSYTMSLNKRLLEAYKEISEHNEKIIDKKHTMFNYGAIITLIEVVLIGINLIIQMF